MKPTEEQKHEDYYKDSYRFYETFAGLQTPEEAKNFVSDLLTASELRMLRRRWHVARLIADGGSIREIAYRAKVGTDTVVRVAKRLNHGTGYLKSIVEAITGKKVVEKEPGVKSKKKEVSKKEKISKYVFG